MFRGRGSFPTRSRGNIGGSGYPYIHYWHRVYCIHYDRNFVIVQILATIIVLMTCLITYILSYKTTFKDPLETIKKIYINSQIIAVLILIIIIGIVSFCSKTKEIIIRYLKVILFLSIILIIIFIGIKINLNNIYNEEKFLEIYEKLDFKEKSNLNNKQSLSINLNGMKLLDSKQTYIEENIKAYNYFTIKSVCIIILYTIVVVFNIYMINKIIKMQEKNKKLVKDDNILFDEEENVKY